MTEGRVPTRPVMTPLDKLEAPVTGDSPPRTGGMVPEDEGRTLSTSTSEEAVVTEEWKAERAAEAAEATARAQGLVGRTVASATVEPHDDDTDCVNVLVLTMTDGTVWRVKGSYGSYTGYSCDEYPEYVGVSQDA